MKEACRAACAVRDMGYMPEQVQDFYPTPSTMSTCMFYTGVDPRTMESVYIPRDPHEKAMQRALIQYRKPENYKLVREALLRAGARTSSATVPSAHPPRAPGGFRIQGRYGQEARRQARRIRARERRRSRQGRRLRAHGQGRGGHQPARAQPGGTGPPGRQQALGR